MRTLQIELADEQFHVIDQQAQAQGFSDSNSYVKALVQRVAEYELSFALEEPLSAEELKRHEQLLLESLECGEPEVADDDWWKQLQADVDADIKAKAAQTETA